MGKKRDQIRMTDDEVRVFIDQGKTLQLATINKDGSPHLVAMWYGINDQGEIVIETFGKAQKTLNMRRETRVAALLETGTTYNQLRGVQINAEAELVEDEAKVHEVMRLVLGRNHPGMDDKTLDTAVQVGGKKRVAAILHPKRIVSWDHTKLSGQY